jgi:integrase
MLQAGDIDLGGQYTHIKRTWGSRAKANQEKRFNGPKGRWDRLVDTSEQLAEAMKPFPARCAEPTAWVFPGMDPGMPMHLVTLLGRWTKL